jgi:hypothetical protein
MNHQLNGLREEFLKALESSCKFKLLKCNHSY